MILVFDFLINMRFILSVILFADYMLSFVILYLSYFILYRCPIDSFVHFSSLFTHISFFVVHVFCCLFLIYFLLHCFIG